MSLSELQTFVSAVGVPAAILGIVLLFCYRFGRWIGPRADKVVDRHLQFLQHSEETQTKQTETLAQQGELLGRTVRALSEFTDVAESVIDDDDKEVTRRHIERARDELSPD